MVSESDAAFDKARSFRFQQAALQAGVRLADSDASACSDDAVPGNACAPRRGGHRASGGASAAGQADGAGKLTIGDHATLGDALHERVNRSPGIWHGKKIAAEARS